MFLNLNLHMGKLILRELTTPKITVQCGIRLFLCSAWASELMVSPWVSYIASARHGDVMGGRSKRAGRLGHGREPKVTVIFQFGLALWPLPQAILGGRGLEEPGWEAFYSAITWGWGGNLAGSEGRGEEGQVCVGPWVSGGGSRVLCAQQVFVKSVQRHLLAACCSEFRTPRYGGAQVTTVLRPKSWGWEPSLWGCWEGSVWLWAAQWDVEKACGCPRPGG